jgi:hypothetical protein
MGVSIQKSSFSPLDNVTIPTYLGRPWKEYSTTVIMQFDIGSFLNPLDWIEWVTNVEPPKTIFYAEYQNTGARATVDQRVQWENGIPADVFGIFGKIDGSNSEWRGFMCTVHLPKYFNYNNKTVREWFYVFFFIKLRLSPPGYFSEATKV